MSSSNASTPETPGLPAPTQGRVGQPAWQRRLPMAICLLVLAYWYLKPPAGAGFMRVPVAPAQAPAWSLTNLLGQRLDSSAFTGRVVVLNFWATFCPQIGRAHV